MSIDEIITAVLTSPGEQKVGVGNQTGKENLRHNPRHQYNQTCSTIFKFFKATKFNLCQESNKSMWIMEMTSSFFQTDMICWN